MFPDFDFSRIQIKLSAMTTFATEPVPDDKETNNKVLVTDGPISDVNNPKDPNNQPTDTPTNS